MGNSNQDTFELPPEQQAIRDKCFHPSGTIVEFSKANVEASIPARFEKIVRLYSDRLAVKDKGRSLTYDQLNRTANRIARAILANRGEGSEPIALLFEHGIDVIAAIFGVLKAGKFYVALDPSFPKERIDYILEDSGARLLVTNHDKLGFANTLVKDVRSTLNIDEINENLTSNNLGLVISTKDFVRINYTSGSTGKPKGVPKEQLKSLQRAIMDTIEIPVYPEDRMSLLHTVGFGSASVCLYQSLLNGASLFPFNYKVEGVDRLASWIKEEQITILHSPPVVFRQLAETSTKQEKLKSLRLIRLSGSATTRLDFDLYRKNFPPATSLEVQMGSTETGTITRAILDHTFAYPNDGVPIGYPTHDYTIFIVDENNNKVPGGEVGEIAVKGRHLNLGYWRSPDLTMKNHLADPHSGDEQIYLTGDLGRMLSDGFLIHLGRKDFMVKIRGYRVELGEIARTLLAHPQIKDAGVVAWDQEPGEKYLVAYVVPREDAAPTFNELHNFLKEKLPDYMMPSAFVFLQSLPLTNGKLDRTALPPPDHQRPNLEKPYAPPHGDVEVRLVQLWEEVLNVRPIGMHDNFFDLGGHSLAASRVISRVIQTFQLELPVKALFDAPTVAEMAAIITKNQTKLASDAELAQMLHEVEAMTEEEAQKQLAI